MSPASSTPETRTRSFWPSTLILVVFIISQGNIASIVLPLKPNIMAMQFAFTPARFSEILREWGPEGVARYHSHFAYDLVHPLIFGLFGWVLVRTSPLFEGLGRTTERVVRWLLPVAAGLDYIENSCQLRLLSVPQGTAEWLIPVSATCASTKWALAAAFVGYLGWRLVIWNFTTPSPSRGT